jgi:hypothetical protein
MYTPVERTFYFRVLIYGLFNDGVFISLYITSNGIQTGKGKGTP